MEVPKFQRINFQKYFRILVSFFKTMTLFESIIHSGYFSVSVIGLAKNVGKTTALNSLIKEAGKKLKLGITSTGWDGEAYDSISGIPKPRIIVPENSIIATTEECVKTSELSHKVIQETDMKTSIGKVVIIEALSKGRIEVAGPVTISELCNVRDMMKASGCNLIFFDGALNRKASASPDVCDAVILSTGMNAGYNIEDVKNKTSFWLEIFTLPSFNRKKMHHGMIKTSKTLLLDREGNIKKKSFPGSYPADFSDIIESDDIMLFPGAVTDETLEEFIKSKSICGVCAYDATKIFLSLQIVRRWMKMGGRIFLQKPTRIIGITVNPTTVSGRAYDASEFLLALSGICAPYPVWDVVSGKGMNIEYDRETEA